jgi:RNA polymerase sigma factor (sigma-70 family)
MIRDQQEETTINSILDGEIELFEGLIRKINPVVYRVGRSYGFSHEDTEDLMQETFISAYRTLSSFQHRASFKTWIIKIMLSHCYHKCQRFSFKYEKPSVAELSDLNIPLFSNSQNDMEKKILNSELKAVIEDAIASIPPDYRMVFVLRELNGLSVAETSDTLAISEANVKVRLNRAKAMLRKEIEKTFSAEEIFEFNLIYCDRITNNVMKAIREMTSLTEKGQPEQ